MMLNISELYKCIEAARFSDIMQVTDSVIRSTRKVGELPFAVYYFDLAQELPKTEGQLGEYQDRVIGSRYFEGRKSLQWNNYFYFITSRESLATGEGRLVKELIERDRRYARKFVITEDDIDFALTPSVAEVKSCTPQADILSVWTDCLVAAGLDKAIFSDEGLPTRLNRIESSSPVSASRPKPKMQKTPVKREPFIYSLELKRFRRFPLQHDYTFGTVNLIFGANGSGKTSLLEAIELFYCGANRRNPRSTPAYDMTVVLSDGQTKAVTHERRLQELRDKNLAWYGVSEVKTSKLYQSFARFNFLDTDAAVSLSESTSRIEDDLSRLLVGPDASKTWHDIQRVCEALSSRLREIRPLKEETEYELKDLEKRLQDAANVAQESDSICGRLDEMIHRLGWKRKQDDKEEFAGRLAQALSELVSLAQQTTALDWVEAPVSIKALAKYGRNAKTSIQKAEADIIRLEDLEKHQEPLRNALKRNREALDLTKQIKHMIDADMPMRVAERSEQQAAVATYSGWLAGFHPEAQKVLSTSELDMKVIDCYRNALSRRADAEASLAVAKSTFAKFSKLRDQAFNLAQQLRQIATKIIEISPKPDECPLCHTSFRPGELLQQINAGTDKDLEPLGQELLDQLQERDARTREAISLEAVADWLVKFCERSSLSCDVSVGSALAKVAEANRKLAEARTRLDALNKEVDTLESQGFSAVRLHELKVRLAELGYPLTELSSDTIVRLIESVTQSAVSSLQTFKNNSSQIDGLQKNIVAILGSAEKNAQRLRGALSQLKERLTATEHIQTRLQDFCSSFPWSEGKPLAEFVVEANAVRKVAVQLKTALDRERQTQATYAESIKRNKRLRERLAKLRARMKRLSEAYATLEKLQKEYSLNCAMEMALQQNRSTIETIFTRIHSPAEFLELGSNLTTLVRRADGNEATLSEISTGQRAAFALSIFLAQNAQLAAAPPVVLIDDPIAHVDDMNSLSFLDYLRDVALTEQRQIFFATANEKLATLFERKFDFLGNEKFRRFNLRRDMW